MIATLDTLFYKFIWNYKTERISRIQLSQPYKYGGLKMVQIKSLMYASKHSWLRRYLQCGKREWHNLFEYFVKCFGSFFIIATTSHSSNRFWYEVVDSWRMFERGIIIDSREKCLSQPIWDNSLFSVNKDIIPYVQWIEKGVIFVNDLLNANGSFMTYEDFIDCYDVQCNFFQFNSVKTSIFNVFKEFLQINDMCKMITPICPYQVVLLIKNRKGCSNLRKIIDLTSNNCLLIRDKWELDLERSLTDQYWYDVNTNPFNVAVDSRLRSFQYKVNNRVLTTNEFAVKIGVSDNKLCTFCNLYVETITHLLSTCYAVQAFYNDLLRIINERCGHDLSFLSSIHFIFGYSARDNLNLGLNKILMYARYFIYMTKCQKINFLRVENFLLYLKLQYKCENYLACMNNRLLNFEQTWDIWHRIFP